MHGGLDSSLIVSFLGSSRELSPGDASSPAPVEAHQNQRFVNSLQMEFKVSRIWSHRRESTLHNDTVGPFFHFLGHFMLLEMIFFFAALHYCAFRAQKSLAWGRLAKSGTTMEVAVLSNLRGHLHPSAGSFYGCHQKSADFPV